MAHELTHVMQQGASDRSRLQGKWAIGQTNDIYEQEADAQAVRVTEGHPVHVQRQPDTAWLQRQGDGDGGTSTMVSAPTTSGSELTSAGLPGSGCGKVTCPSPESLGLHPSTEAEGKCGPDWRDQCARAELLDVSICAPDTTGNCLAWCTYKAVNCLCSTGHLWWKKETRYRFYDLGEQTDPEPGKCTRPEVKSELPVAQQATSGDNKTT